VIIKAIIILSSHCQVLVPHWRRHIVKQRTTVPVRVSQFVSSLVFSWYHFIENANVCTRVVVMGTVFLVTRTLINIDDRCWVSYRFVGSVLTMSLSRLFLCTHFACWVCLFAKWIISLIICHGLYIPAYRNRFSKNTHLEVFLCVCVCVIHMYVHKYIRTYIHYNIHTHTYI